MGTVTPAWYDGLGVIIIYYRSTSQSDSSLSLIYIHVLWITLMSQKLVINWIINWCFINSISTSCGPNMSAHGEILLWLAGSLGPIISILLSGHWWLLNACAFLHPSPQALMTWGQYISISLTGTILFASIPCRLMPFSPHRPDLAPLLSPHSPARPLSLIAKHL